MWVDESVPGEPLVEVRFVFRRVRDADLARLKWLPKLQTLDLSGTQVSDAGLAHLKELANLQELNLSRNGVAGI